MEQPKPESANTAQNPVKLDDFRALARTRVPSSTFDYIDCAACDEITSHSNRHDFDQIRLRPLCMRDVSSLDMSANLFGQSYNVPIGFSPTAFHRLVHERGEIATASAARALSVPMIVSSMSSITLEEVARDSGNDNLWLQTYIFKDRNLTRELVERGECSGYKSIVVTMGCPVTGKRDRNIINEFSLPRDIVAANFRKSSRVVYNNPIHSVDGVELDPSVTWKDVEWLRNHSRLPIILKGITNPMDVCPALDVGASGLIVSNHGGRQLDTTDSTIRILPEVARVVSGRIPVFVDSGIRRGTDVLKSLALGADAILLGRPVLWALAVDGERGILDAVNLLTEELRIAMQIAGCSSIDEIKRNSPNIVYTRPL